MSDRPRVALVTGASGFIGSHVVESLLAHGWRVRCLVRKASVLRWIPTDDVTLINGDVRVAGEDLDRAVRNVSVVFHLAGLTSAANDVEYIASNVEGTRNVVDAMRRSAADALLVFASSLAAAGPAQRRPVNETDDPSPVSAYGRSKLTAERIVTSSGIEYMTIRPPAVTVHETRTFLPLSGWLTAGSSYVLRLKGSACPWCTSMILRRVLFAPLSQKAADCTT